MTGGIVRFYDLSPPEDGFPQEILQGLSRSPKELPAKYFYDEQGSALFEAICELPEYYLTRAELELMERHVREIAEFVGPDCELIEFGSGSGRKTRLLVEAARPAVYVPVDIADAQLRQSSAELAALFPWLNICALCADFTRPLALPAWKGIRTRRRVVYFPGSTVGNFTQEEAARFMARLRTMVGNGGAVVVGVDLKKDVRLLHAAYNDAQGVTAAFNLNILRHVNRRLGADFDIGSFEHVAFYSAERSRIEMHLRARRRQAVTVAGHTVLFAEGELMRTEISCKYAVEEFQALGKRAGLRPLHAWFDAARRFGVHGFAAD